MVAHITKKWTPTFYLFLNKSNYCCSFLDVFLRFELQTSDSAVTQDLLPISASWWCMNWCSPVSVWDMTIQGATKHKMIPTNCFILAAAFINQLTAALQEKENKCVALLSVRCVIFHHAVAAEMSWSTTWTPQCVLLLHLSQILPTVTAGCQTTRHTADENWCMLITGCWIIQVSGRTKAQLRLLKKLDNYLNKEIKKQKNKMQKLEKPWESAAKVAKS